MNNIKEDSGATRADQLNYFNYFTEIEEEFVRRRGKPLLISPMEWALVESWKTAGIPLHVVLRAINQAFDSYEARTRKYRRVNSVFYCQQEVEATYAEYCLAQVGSSPAASSEAEQNAEAGKSKRKRVKHEVVEVFPKEVIVDFLARSTDELRLAESQAASNNHIELRDAIGRSRARLEQIARAVAGATRVDAEALERDLDAIDRMILEGAAKAFGEGSIEQIKSEGERQLEAYRKKMDRSIYDQTFQNFVSRRLREMARVPRLSLFYL